MTPDSEQTVKQQLSDASSQAREQAQRAIRLATEALALLQQAAMEDVLSSSPKPALPVTSPSPLPSTPPARPCTTKTAALAQLRTALEQGAHYVAWKPAVIVTQPVVGQGKLQQNTPAITR